MLRNVFVSGTMDANEDAVLVVGLVCVDFILICSHYPQEDSANRALDVLKRRGGNGSNTCTVLSQLGIKCELLAPFGGDDHAVYLKKDLQENGISFEHCPIHLQCNTPFTNLIISLATGSRTGVHFRKDFPESSFDDFIKINLSNYDWVHFEGRNLTETQQMMAAVDSWNKNGNHKKLSFSVELEKQIEETKHFIPLADFLFVSKDFAQFMGFDGMRSTLMGIAPLVKTGAVIIVPWGEQGAMARCANGNIVKSRAYPPAQVLDSIGAGDTFIAATISVLLKNKSVEEAITFGCKVAGAKVGITGFMGLKDKFLAKNECIADSP